MIDYFNIRLQVLHYKISSHLFNKLNHKIFRNKLWNNISSSYSSSSSLQNFDNISSNTSSQLHHNNFDIELHHNFISTNSSTIIVTDLQQTLLITNFHNIIQELEGYSSHTFTTFSQHTSSTTNINIVLCDRLFITYFHNIITNSSSNISTSFNTSSTHLHHASTNSSTSFNKMNEYRFSFTAYSTNSSSTFIHIHFNKSWYNSLSTFISTNHDTILYQHSSQTFTIGELVIDHSLHTSTNTSSWLSDRSSTNLSQQHIQMVIHYIHSTNSSSIFIISLSQNSHNKLWYNSSLYIIQRTSVSFVNVRIVHTSYHKTFITLQQTMKQFFIIKLSKQSSLISSCYSIMLISSC